MTFALTRLIAAVLAAALTMGAGHAQQIARGKRRIAIDYTEITGTQAMSSAPWVAHAKGFHLWEVGKPASVLVQELAENGNPEFILGTAVSDESNTYGDLAVGLPNRPGTSRHVELWVDDVHPLVSGGWMLTQTNDGFAGIDALDAFVLTKPVTIEVYALDAGTEKNTESRADTLGGLGHMPENGVVHRHPGIRGDVDIPASFGFDPAKPVGRITISPVATRTE